MAPRKRQTGGRRTRLSPRQLMALIEDAIIDAHDESEQRVGFLTPILNLPLPSPPPTGWEWIEAYRYWARANR